MKEFYTLSEHKKIIQPVELTNQNTSFCLTIVQITICTHSMTRVFASQRVYLECFPQLANQS